MFYLHNLQYSVLHVKKEEEEEEEEEKTCLCPKTIVTKFHFLNHAA